MLRISKMCICTSVCVLFRYPLRLRKLDSAHYVHAICALCNASSSLVATWPYQPRHWTAREFACRLAIAFDCWLIHCRLILDGIALDSWSGPFSSALLAIGLIVGHLTAANHHIMVSFCHLSFATFELPFILMREAIVSLVYYGPEHVFKYCSPQHLGFVTRPSALWSSKVPGVNTLTCQVSQVYMALTSDL